MTTNKIGGVMPPIMTIFGGNGHIDWDANFRHQEFLIKKGINGVAYLGTTGEFSALTLGEKKEFLKKMSSHANGRITTLAGVSDTCLSNVLELTHFCEGIGIDGLLLLPPYYSVYPDDMVAAYISAAAKATRLPIILYNIPALTGFEMTEEWVQALALQHENIVGIKETVPSASHMEGMMKVKQARKDFMVFAAYDDQFLKAKHIGADGFIHAAGNFAPEVSIALWKCQDETETDALYRKVLAAMEIYQQALPLYLAVKEAVYQREHLPNCSERLPACSLTEKQKAAIRRIMQEQHLMEM